MSCVSALALILPTPAYGAAALAITFTAVILIPAGFLFGFLREKMTAKISKKQS